MVRAILEGRKTQTRRVIKHPTIPNSDITNFQEFLYIPKQEPKDFYTPSEGYYALLKTNANQDFGVTYFKCPYGQVGDRLWVKETWCAGCAKEEKRCACYKVLDDGRAIKFWPSCVESIVKSSLFMPRWASRINRTITLLRVERLLDISNADVRAEGFNSRDEFIATFLRLNHLPEDANPWDWVIGWQNPLGNLSPQFPSKEGKVNENERGNESVLI